ncbi:MAG: hypothetical protein LUE87_11540, partial [Lachnospiraceae bacterium]|nr:hypothetical protein [Lachnospiraceae bacterium]
MKCDVLNTLMGYAARINLGTLKNAIQLSCAKALLKDGAMQTTGEITVTLHDLSFQIHSVAADSSQQLNLRSDWYHGDMHVGINDTGKFDSDEILQFEDIYDQVFSLIDEGRKMGLTGEGLRQRVSRQIDLYFETLGDRYNTVIHSISSMERFVSPKILPVAIKLMSTAAIEMDRTYPQKTPLLLAMHLEQYVSRARSGNLVLPPNIQGVAGYYKTEIQFLESHREWLGSHLSTRVTDDEIVFLAAFLSQTEKTSWEPGVHITMVSCSGRVAAEITGYVRSLFGAGHVYCVENGDMLAVRKVYDLLCFDLKQHHGREGNLIFTDCQQFSGSEEDLYQATGIRCKVIPVLEERMAVIACRNTMTQQLPLEEMYNHIMLDYGEQMRCFFENSHVPGILMAGAEKKPSVENVIFTICVTGQGSAEQMRKFLEEELRDKIPSLKVVAVSSIDDVSARAAVYGKALRVIVGTVNPNIPGVPFLLADNVFTPAGIEKIMNIISDWSMPPYMGWLHEGREESASQTQMDNFCVLAPNVDREKGTACISRVTRVLENEVYRQKLPDNIELRIFMHAASMLERIATGNPLELPQEGPEEIARSQKWFLYLKEVLNSCFSAAGFPVSDAECFYFMITLPKVDETFE